jgi:hypothetical protein
MPAQNKNGTLAVYLGIVQFFFATTWTLYVIYLPQLGAAAILGSVLARDCRASPSPCWHLPPSRGSRLTRAIW